MKRKPTRAPRASSRIWRARPRGARAGPRALLALQGRRRPQTARGRDRHRLQHRERLLRPDPVRRAGGGVQGGLRRAVGLRRDRGGGRLEAADGALRPLPADPVGVLRRHRGPHVEPPGAHADDAAVRAAAPPLRRPAASESRRRDAAAGPAAHREPQPQEPPARHAADRAGRGACCSTRTAGRSSPRRASGARSRAPPCLAADTLAARGRRRVPRRRHQRPARRARGGRVPAHLRLGPAPDPRRDGRGQRVGLPARARAPRTATTRAGARARGCGAADLLVGSRPAR